jgi:hypothetical protein
VLAALTRHSFTKQMRQAGAAALANGIDVPSDIAAGRTLGERVGTLVLQRLRRYR